MDPVKGLTGLKPTRQVRQYSYSPLCRPLGAQAMFVWQVQHVVHPRSFAGKRSPRRRTPRIGRGHRSSGRFLSSRTSSQNRRETPSGPNAAIARRTAGITCVPPRAVCFRKKWTSALVMAFSKSTLVPWLGGVRRKNRRCVRSNASSCASASILEKGATGPVNRR